MQALLKRKASGRDRLPETSEEIVNIGRVLGQLADIGRGSGEATRHAAAYDLHPSVLGVHGPSMTAPIDIKVYQFRHLRAGWDLTLTCSATPPHRTAPVSHRPDRAAPDTLNPYRRRLGAWDGPA